MTKVYNMYEKRQKQEDPLNLRSLASVAPPEQDGWPAIQQALLDRSRHQRILRRAGGALAAAATVVLAMALLLGNPDPMPQDALQPTASNTAAASPDPATRSPALDSLMSLSQQLETRLRLYRDELGDLPAGALVYQIELQDLVAQVDDEISTDPDSLDLWSQRVNLLLDITRLYENTLRREYHQMASL